MDIFTSGKEIGIIFDDERKIIIRSVTAIAYKNNFFTNIILVPVDYSDKYALFVFLMNGLNNGILIQYYLLNH